MGENDMITEKLHEELTRAIDLLDAGNPAAALQLLDKYSGHTPTDPHAHFYRGVTLAELGRLDEAIQAYRTGTDIVLMTQSPYTLGDLLFEAAVIRRPCAVGLSC